MATSGKRELRPKDYASAAKHLAEQLATDREHILSVYYHKLCIFEESLPTEETELLCPPVDLLTCGEPYTGDSNRAVAAFQIVFVEDKISTPRYIVGESLSFDFFLHLIDQIASPPKVPEFKRNWKYWRDTDLGQLDLCLAFSEYLAGLYFGKDWQQHVTPEHRHTIVTIFAEAAAALVHFAKAATAEVFSDPAGRAENIAGFRYTVGAVTPDRLDSRPVIPGAATPYCGVPHTVKLRYLPNGTRTGTGHCPETGRDIEVTIPKEHCAVDCPACGRRFYRMYKPPC